MTNTKPMIDWDEVKFATMISEYYMSCGANGFEKSNPMYVKIVEFVDSLLNRQREEMFEYMTETEVKQHIKQCEGKHPQQVAYSSHHDCFTQVCFVCRKVRSSYKKRQSLKEEKV